MVTLFSLMYHHKSSIQEWENMEPWERDAYLRLLTNTVEAENERIRQENANANGK